MIRSHIFILIILATIIVGCNSTQRALDGTSTQTPLKLEFDVQESAQTPMRLRSGQVFIPPFCCPPLFLRNVNGAKVQKFDSTAGEQRLVAPAGMYELVGHDPAGGECVLHLEVVND